MRKSFATMFEMAEYKMGDRVQVLVTSREIWLNAIIAKRHTTALGFEYEVIGQDDTGPFTGTFDSEHVHDRGKE